MTSDEYWHGDVWLVEGYREADKIRLKRENQGYWLQGLYIYEAIGVSIANAFGKSNSAARKYPSEPYDVFVRQETEEEIEKREEAERLQAMLYMNNMVRAGKNWSNGG